MYPAFRRPFQWESKREVCVKEKEARGREGWREGGEGARATARVRVNFVACSESETQNLQPETLNF